MNNVNYYEFLGTHAGATQKEIRQAYLNKLKEWHPDKNAHRLKEAEEVTKLLNNAYYILSDPERRKQYDRMLRFTKGKDYSETLNDRAFSEKLKKTSPILNQILTHVRTLYSLFSDAVKGKYKIHPVTLGIIGGGLLYFVIPTDLIPDFIPLIGYLDDLAVLTTVISSMQQELSDYQEWKKKIESDLK